MVSAKKTRKKKAKSKVKPQVKYKYLAGRRYCVYPDGSIEYRPVSHVGKYSEKTELLRVPVSVASWLKDLLRTLEEIETCRRNVVGNPFNSSLEYILNFEKVDAFNALIKKETDDE